MSNSVFNRIDEGLHHDKPRFLDSPRKHTQENCLQKPNQAGVHPVQHQAPSDQQHLKGAEAKQHQREPLHAPGK